MQRDLEVAMKDAEIRMRKRLEESTRVSALITRWALTLSAWGHGLDSVCSPVAVVDLVGDDP